MKNELFYFFAATKILLKESIHISIWSINRFVFFLPFCAYFTNGGSFFSSRAKIASVARGFLPLQSGDCRLLKISHPDNPVRSESGSVAVLANLFPAKIPKVLPEHAKKSFCSALLNGAKFSPQIKNGCALIGALTDVSPRVLTGLL